MPVFCRHWKSEHPNLPVRGVLPAGEKIHTSPFCSEESVQASGQNVLLPEARGPFSLGAAGTARHNPQSREAISSTASILSPTKGPQEIDKYAAKSCQAKRIEIHRATTAETK